MKVAIDTGPLTGGHSVRGIGMHTGELIKALTALAKKKKGVRVDAVDFSKVSLSSYDIVHYPYFHPHFSTLPREKLAKKVAVTIHDLIQLKFTEKYVAGGRGKIRLALQRSRLKNVDAIVTISQESKKDIVGFLGVDERMVHSIPLAAKAVFSKPVSPKRLSLVEEKYNLPERFILYVGDINYNKNIPTLIQAAKDAGMNLVMVGKQALEVEKMELGLEVLSGPRDWFRFLFNIPHPELAHFRRIKEQFKDSKKIQRLGFVSDEDLAAVYKLATLYCQPSFAEGFGLPVLEAMVSGTPVVASKIPSHMEIAKNAVVYFPSKSVKKLSKTIKSLTRSKKLREELIKRGKKRGKDFSWQKTAQGTLKVYKSLLNED